MDEFILEDEPLEWEEALGISNYFDKKDIEIH